MKKTTRLLSLVLVIVLCLSVLPLSAAAASGGWQQIEGDWYYIENGAAATGWRKINSTWYYLVPEWGGIMCTGWLNTDPTYFQEDGTATGDWYHFSSSGAMEASKWVKDTYTYEGTTYTDWYYMLSNGKGATGWQKIGGVWYYFDPDAGDAMVSGGMREIKDKWYYFKDSGALYTGWKELGGIDGDGNPFSFWAYFTSNGAVQDAWKKINGSWYYFDDIVMLTGGPYEIDGNYYYFNDSGSMFSGWKKIIPIERPGGTIEYDWGYFTPSGALKINGWEKAGSYWYYFEGARYYHDRGLTLNGKNYLFDSNGHMITGWYHDHDDLYYIGWQYYLSSGARVESGSLKINGKWYHFWNGYLRS